ncbi:hypothetical protein DEA8626_01376 [Defluviimonas aquaemixtae]|uniref:Uncharacterized protein n=1 Tax=Albidovulum aquaemixtae TaxID=1542388 RepID=A0A2R8B5G2_9RHOB|nr:hypothetical protein [Defluviimonas aquaemixtae]SPH17849.1 hypothetical protein DEA8626_01376 [Defluviimonas aquaemixtae]
MSQPHADETEPEGAGDDRAPNTLRILSLGIAPALLERVRETTGASFVIAQFPALDVQLLAQVMPDIVLAPLLGQGFDILDLADRLSEMGYRGALHAVTPPLPDPDAVRREVTSHCEGVVFSLIVLDEQTPD